MDKNDFVDSDAHFPNFKSKIILNTLKPALMIALDKILNLLPNKYIVDSIEKCNSTELKRQYLAFDRGIAKWQRLKYAGTKGRPQRALRLMQKVFFTILTVEAHYQVLTSFMLDEYKKIRENKENVEGITKSD